MKKIFTLLMALTLVFSVSAAPVTLPALNTQMSKKQSVAKVELKKDIATLDANKGVKSIKAVAAKKNARKAAQAAGAPVAAQAAYWGTYTQVSGDYYLSFFDADDDWVGGLSIVTADISHIAGTFAVTQESQWVFAVGDTADVTSASLIVQGLRYESYPIYHVSGVLEDANGRQITLDNDINLTYAYDYHKRRMYSQYSMYCEYMQMYCDEAEENADYEIDLQDIEIIETGDTYDFTFDCFSKVVYEDYKTTDFSASNDDTLGIILSIKTIAELEDRIYTSAELDMNYCYIIDQRGETVQRISFETLSLEVSFDGDTTFLYADEALGKDGNRYNILVKYFIPQPKDIVDLGALSGNQTINEDGNFLYYGYSADSVNYAMFALKVDTIFGTFDKNDMDRFSTALILNDGQDTIYPMINLDAEIVRSQPTVATATVSMLSNDLVQYNFTLDFTVAHEPTSVIIPVELDTVANISFGEYPYDFYGITLYQKYFVVSAANDKYAVAVGILADTIQNDTVYEAGSFYDAMIMDVDADSAIYSHSDASLHVFKVADTTFFNLDFLSYQTGDLYRVSMRYYIPEAIDTVRFAADKGVSRDLVYSSSMFMVNAAHQISADSAYLISLFVVDASDLYGDFNQNSLYGAPLALVVGTDTKDTTDIDVLVADIHIVPSNGDSALATVYAQGRDNIIYDFSVKFAVRDAFADDAADGIDLTFEFDKSQINLSQTVPYDTLMVGAVVGTDNYFLSMRFLTNAVAIANGDYSIDDVNNAYNHVNASHGSQLFFEESYGFYTDWTGAFLLKNLNYLTYEAEATWYLESGTVTVSDAQIEINAVNHNGAEVHILIKRTATALEDLILDKAAPRKVLDNGRVVIIRDGKAFGLDGRRIR